MVESLKTEEGQVPNDTFDTWLDGAIQLGRTQSEIAKLMELKALAASQQATLTKLFLDRFSSLLLQIKPNMYALIKPSRRQNITSAVFLGQNASFRTNDGRGVILTEYVDYVIVELSDSKTWNVNTLDEHRDWLVAVMAELDEAEQRASENV